MIHRAHQSIPQAASITPFRFVNELASRHDSSVELNSRESSQCSARHEDDVEDDEVDDFLPRERGRIYAQRSINLSIIVVTYPSYLVNLPTLPNSLPTYINTHIQATIYSSRHEK